MFLLFIVLSQSISKYIPYLYYRDAKRLLPDLEYSYLTGYPKIGIRAQLFDKQERKLAFAKYITGLMRGDRTIKEEEKV